MASHSKPQGSILDDIYAGTLDASRWQRGMIRLCDALRATCAGLFSFDATHGTLVRDEGYRVPDEHIREYSGWVAEGLEPRVELMVPKPLLEPQSEGTLMDSGRWERTEIFNDFLSKVDCAYFLCTWLCKGPKTMAALSFQASQRRGPFDHHDMRRLEPLLPHIARGLEIRDRLEIHSIRGDSLSSGLDRAQFAMMVLDSSGALMEANAVAEKLLRSEPSIRRDPDGRIRLAGSADSRLQLWIEQGRPDPQRLDAVIHIARPLKLPLSLVVAPILEEVQLWGRLPPRWVLFFFDPEAKLEPSASILVKDLGLTEREAQLAALVAIGLELQQAAKRLGISVHTARVHLRAIFSKTGTHSQQQLVSRILRGPGGMLLS